MTDLDCRPLEERERLLKENPPQYSTFKVLRGCKGYDWFCTNIENKIVRAWETNGLCTGACKKGSLSWPFQLPHHNCFAVPLVCMCECAR